MTVAVLRRLSRLVLLVGLGGGLAFTLGAYAARFLDLSSLPGERQAEGAPEPGPRAAVNALGRIEPAGGVIAILGPPGDRVGDLLVQQGAVVKKDQVLVRLASHADRMEEQRLSEAQLAEANWTLAAINGSQKAKLAEIDTQEKSLKDRRDVELKAQRPRVALLKKQLAQARKTRDRIASLQTSRAKASPQELEQQGLQVAQAEGELAVALAALDKIERTFEQESKGIQAQRRSVEAEFDLARAKVPLRSLQQSAALARRRARAAELEAPVAGTVLRVIGQPGSPTGSQPILELGAGGGMIVRAEVYVTDVRLLADWLRQGPVSAEVTSSALPGPLQGQLQGRESIARTTAKGNLVSLSPRADADRRVVEARIDLDPASTEQALRFVGLEVDVRLERRAGP
jgi:HlyD family secretion protein